MVHVALVLALVPFQKSPVDLKIFQEMSRLNSSSQSQHYHKKVLQMVVPASFLFIYLLFLSSYPYHAKLQTILIQEVYVKVADCSPSPFIISHDGMMAD